MFEETRGISQTLLSFNEPLQYLAYIINLWNNIVMICLAKYIVMIRGKGLCVLVITSVNSLYNVLNKTTGLIKHVQKVYTSLGTSCHNAYTKFFCWLLMHTCILIAISPKCVHQMYKFIMWSLVSNCNSQAKCIHAWADNNRIGIEEVPKLVYAFWICKPVIRLLVNQSKSCSTRGPSPHCA